MYRQFARRLLCQVLLAKKTVDVIPTSSLTRRAGQLRIMKLDSPQFQTLFTPELKKLVACFKQANFELRIAGGAVRDLLMGKEPHDVDFATTATPTEMKALFEREKIRMINNKGEKHGTITARIDDKENFEVTTLRIDVVTDGRHAEVQFTTDWQLDANRRDLTINAMFLGFDGTVYDYFHGRDDVEQRRVRFVGSPAERIQEDFLRILRYFRFYGRIAKGPDTHDAESLEAIRQHAGGLAGVSGERLWMELQKIIVGNFASSIVALMLELGIGPFLGLPANVDTSHYKEICERTEGLSPLPATRLASLMTNENEVYELNKRLKMSTEELKLMLFIMKHRSDDMGDNPLRYCQDLMVDTVGREPKVKDRIIELLKYKGEKTVMEEFQVWNLPKFPITGYDLFEHNVPKGPVFAKTLNSLRQIWKKSNYRMEKEELMEKIEEVVKQNS